MPSTMMPCTGFWPEAPGIHSGFFSASAAFFSMVRSSSCILFTVFCAESPP